MFLRLSPFCSFPRQSGRQQTRPLAGRYLQRGERPSSVGEGVFPFESGKDESGKRRRGCSAGSDSPASAAQQQVADGENQDQQNPVFRRSHVLPLGFHETGTLGVAFVRRFGNPLPHDSRLSKQTGDCQNSGSCETLLNQKAATPRPTLCHKGRPVKKNSFRCHRSATRSFAGSLCTLPAFPGFIPPSGQSRPQWRKAPSLFSSAHSNR